MNNIQINKIALVLIILTAFSCYSPSIQGPASNTDTESEINLFTPIFQEIKDIETEVATLKSRTFENTGKIYIYKDYVFVNEKFKGIHVIDASNPSDLKNIHFLNIPGNVDMAVKDDLLFADMFNALLTIDISNISDIKVRDTDTFVYPNYFEGFFQHHINNDLFSVQGNDKDFSFGQDNSFIHSSFHDTNRVITGFKYNGLEVGSPYNDRVGFDGFPERVNDTALVTADSQTGQAGSLARFLVIEDYLYTLNISQMVLYKINTPTQSIDSWSNINVTWNIETIFRLKDRLFIGSTTGLFMYDITQVSNPKFISSYQHLRNCDPVVADDNYAYLTLRSGNPFCFGTQNELQIINITQIQSPVLVSTVALNNPHGLGLINEKLIVCDADSGLKIIDVKDRSNPIISDFINGIDPRDIIIQGQTAFVVSTNGIWVYNIDSDVVLTALDSLTF